MQGAQIAVLFDGQFRCAESGRTIEGRHCARLDGPHATLAGHSGTVLTLTPLDARSTFELGNVTIGIGFHWQRLEKQRFGGRLRLVADGGRLHAINLIPIEQYLTSVISSEMCATSSLQLLKAHAVTSRSWLMAQLAGRSAERQPRPAATPEADIRWYDREDHRLFDVCADDHCQRYQGITRAANPAVSRAVAETEGLVLTADGRICDARFSKCCGGMTELYENCWDDTPHSYLTALADTPDEVAPADLTREENARRWIESEPEAFCNTADAGTLRQILNSYDRETPDFYRWSVSYTADELRQLLRTKTGIDFGDIRSLTPVRRGPSGRIVTLRIEGSLRTMTVGKELEIRRILSPTHLYSSAFVVDRTESGFSLRGAGWGHGVGLCQIGAAVMGEHGYDFRQILAHYFKNAVIEKRW